MKKLVFVLAVFIAVPAFALVVDLNDIGNGQVAIQYRQADPCNLPRMFTLDITIDSPAKIDNVSSYHQGESSSASRGYGIYPARIDINSNGTVNDYGSPLAYSGDPGAGTGLGTGHVVLEFGSLYYGDINCPATSGTLCVLDVNCNEATGSVNIVMVDEDTYRGGLVFEDVTEGEVNDTLVYLCGEPSLECLKPTAPEYAAWVAWGKPACWCYKRQCRGDIDGLKVGLFWVQLLDLNCFKDAFNKQDPQLALACNGNGICADFNHTKTGLFRVQLLDLNIFKAYFNKVEALVPCCDNNQDCILDAGDNYNFWTN